MFGSPPPTITQRILGASGVDPTGATNSLTGVQAVYNTANSAATAAAPQLVYWDAGTYLIDTTAVSGVGVQIAANVNTYLAPGCTVVIPYRGSDPCYGFVLNNSSAGNNYFWGAGTLKGTNPHGSAESVHWGIFFSNTSAMSRYGVTSQYSSAGGATFVGFLGKAISDTVVNGSGVVYRGLTFGQGAAGNAIGVDGIYSDLTVERIRITATFAGFSTAPGESIIASNNTAGQSGWTWEDIVSTGWANLNLSGTILNKCTFNLCSFTIGQGVTGDAGALNIDSSVFTNCIWSNCTFDASATTVGPDSRGMGNSAGGSTWTGNKWLNCVFRSKTGQANSLWLDLAAGTSGNIINNSAANTPSGTGAMHLNPSAGFTAT